MVTLKPLPPESDVQRNDTNAFYERIQVELSVSGLGLVSLSLRSGRTLAEPLGRNGYFMGSVSIAMLFRGKGRNERGDVVMNTVCGEPC